MRCYVHSYYEILIFWSVACCCLVEMCPPLGEQAYQLVEARNFACSAVVDSVIYVFGGREQPGSWPTPPATLATSQNIALKFLFIFLPIAFITFYDYRYVIMLDKPLGICRLFIYF